MPAKCIFCKLYEAKKGVVYETEKCFVLVDKSPLSTGHLLVVPKVHRALLDEYNQNELTDVLPTIKYLVNKLKLTKYNILQNNGHLQSVHHVHFHLIPFLNEKEGLKINWDPLRTASDEEYNKWVADFRSKLM